MKSSPLWLLPLVVVLGCTAKPDATKTQAKSTLPAPKADSELPGRYLLTVGTVSGDTFKQPFARWCYLDVQVQDGEKLLVDAWRPDEQRVSVTQATLQQDGRILVTLGRTWLQGPEEVETTETWRLEGFLRPLPRVVKRKLKKKAGSGEEEEEEEEEEPAEAAAPAPKGLAGKATVTIEGRRPAPFRFTARRVPEDQEQPWEEKAPPRRERKPTLAELEKLHEAGKLDFESIPPELKDAARRKFGS